MVLLNLCLKAKSGLIRVFQIAVRVGVGLNSPLFGGSQKLYHVDFFTGWREPKQEWFWRFQPFSKLKQLSVNTEHQLKSNSTWPDCAKMEHEQWLQLKMLFWLGYNLKIVIWWGGGIKAWCRESTGGGWFLGGGGMRKFSLGLVKHSAATKYSSTGHHKQKNKKTAGQIKFSAVTIT